MSAEARPREPIGTLAQSMFERRLAMPTRGLRPRALGEPEVRALVTRSDVEWGQ